MSKADWSTRVAIARDRACEAMDAGDFELACACINEGFSITEREGDERHPVFASFLCLAAEISMAAGETEAAASLYRRAHDVARSLGASGLRPLFLALRGLALADAARGWNERAAKRYSEALELLDDLDLPDAAERRREIEAELRALSAPRA